MAQYSIRGTYAHIKGTSPHAHINLSNILSYRNYCLTNAVGIGSVVQHQHTLVSSRKGVSEGTPSVLHIYRFFAEHKEDRKSWAPTSDNNKWEKDIYYPCFHSRRKGAKLFTLVSPPSDMAWFPQKWLKGGRKGEEGEEGAKHRKRKGKKSVETVTVANK